MDGNQEKLFVGQMGELFKHLTKTNQLLEKIAESLQSQRDQLRDPKAKG